MYSGEDEKFPFTNLFCFILRFFKKIPILTMTTMKRSQPINKFLCKQSLGTAWVNCCRY